MKRMIWTVVHRQNKSTPQQETVRYTAESANKMSKLIEDEGGIAVVVEGEEEVAEHDDIINEQANDRSTLTWE